MSSTDKSSTQTNATNTFIGSYSHELPQSSRIIHQHQGPQITNNVGGHLQSNHKVGMTQGNMNCAEPIRGMVIKPFVSYTVIFTVLKYPDYLISLQKSQDKFVHVASVIHSHFIETY